jgi:hypothetical protein
MATVRPALGTSTPRIHSLLSASRIRAACEEARLVNKEMWLSDDLGYRGTGRLVLRIRPNGLCRFYFRTNVDGARKPIPLGPYSRTRKAGFLTIEQARSLARAHAPSVHVLEAPVMRNAPPSIPDAHGRIGIRVTPRERFEAESASVTNEAPVTLMEVCELYVESLRRRKRTSANAIDKLLQKNVFSSAVAGYDANSITEEQIVDLLAEIATSATRYTAEKIRSVLLAAYSTAIESKNDWLSPGRVRSRVRVNPVAGLKKDRLATRPRRRVLRPSERKALWEFLNPRDDSTLTAPMRILRLDLLLAGQRGEQLLAIRYPSDVDLTSAQLRLFDSKGRRDQAREHWLPLCPKALEEVSFFVDFAKDQRSPFLFPGHTKGTPLSRDTISKLVTRISRAFQASGISAEPFQFLDIRRTTETALAELGVSREIRAQLLSHGLSGVQEKHYDFHLYMHEKRRALQTWEDYLASLL